MPDSKLFKINNKKKVKIIDGKYTLIYTGTIAERYGLDIAIKGVDFLRDRIPKIKLMIIGEGEHLVYLKELVARLNLGELVEFYEPVPIDKIPGFVEKADLGISTHRQDSFWELYFSTKIVEFLISGLPVVSSRTKTIQYYFSEDDIFYFKPEDEREFAEKVFLAYSSQELAQEKVKSANKNILNNLSWDKERERYIELVRSLTG